jgi:K+-transporting ATPase ATPase B chain
VEKYIKLNKHVIWKKSAKDALIRLLPQHMIHNPIMFVVWIAALITTIAPLLGILLPQHQSIDPPWFAISIAITIWITLFFATFAESMSKNRRQMYEDRFKLNLLKLPTITLITDKGKHEQVRADELKLGDLIEVKAGNTIPCNGIIKEGEARVDESSITGTFDEQVKNYTNDNEVHAGSQVVVGRLMIEVASVPHEQDISDDINKIKRTSTLTEKSLYVFLGYLTFIFVVTSVSIALMLNVIGAKVSMVMIISLLVCIVPTTVSALISTITTSGMERLMKRGVFIKDEKALETAVDVNHVYIGKTGTLTRKQTMIEAVHICEDVTEKEFYHAANLAVAFNTTREHKAIIKWLQQQKLFKSEETGKLEYIDYNDISPFTGTRKGKDVYGIIEITEINKVDKLVVPNDIKKMTINARNGEYNWWVIFKNQQVIGCLKIGSVIKESAKKLLHSLEKEDVEVTLLSGDNYFNTRDIAQKAGISHYICELIAQDKLNHIEEGQRSGRITVAMIGYGENESLALQRANIGLAFGHGAIKAKRAANIIIMDEDPSKLLDIIEIGKETNATKGCITAFSMVTDFAKYFAIMPAIFSSVYPSLKVLNIMNLTNPHTAILSSVLFNAVIVLLWLPIAIRGLRYDTKMEATKVVQKFLTIYGFTGLIAPFIGIKLIDMFISALFM